MKLAHLLYVIIGGVIIADLVAHASGTTSLFKNFNTLWTIGVRPTDTAAIKTSTSATNGTSGSKKV